MATYYEQRATAGLIVSESLPISPMGVGHPYTPGIYAGAYIANNGYDLARARAAVRSGHADLVAFGVPFLANPDLVCRYREGLPLNQPDSATYYQGGSTGYIDYTVYDALLNTDRQGGTR